MAFSLNFSTTFQSVLPTMPSFRIYDGYKIYVSSIMMIFPYDIVINSHRFQNSLLEHPDYVWSLRVALTRSPGPHDPCLQVLVPARRDSPDTENVTLNAVL